MLEDVPMEMSKAAIEKFLEERMGEVLDSWTFLGYTKRGELITSHLAPTERDESALKHQFLEWAEEEMAVVFLEEEEDGSG